MKSGYNDMESGYKDMESIKAKTRRQGVRDTKSVRVQRHRFKMQEQGVRIKAKTWRQGIKTLNQGTNKDLKSGFKSVQFGIGKYMDLWYEDMKSGYKDMQSWYKQKH